MNPNFNKTVYCQLQIKYSEKSKGKNKNKTSFLLSLNILLFFFYNSPLHYEEKRYEFLNLTIQTLLNHIPVYIQI